MQEIKVSELIPHSRNDYFFDNITGDNWDAFLTSIKERGVIEPLIVTQNKVIVSGHQRLRACKELGITEVLAEIRFYESEDAVLQDLIETNIRQRGLGNPNAVKMGRCIKELERIHGIEYGGDRRSENFKLTIGQLEKTKEDLISEMGINIGTYHRSKKLAEMPEDLQQMVMDGTVSASTASRVLAKLPKDEQERIANEILKQNGKVTSAEVQRIIDGYKNEIAELKNAPPVIKEVYPADYEKAKQQAQIHYADFKKMQSLYDEMAEKWKKAEREKRSLMDEANKPEAMYQREKSLDASELTVGIHAFLEKYGGMTYLMGELDSLDEKRRERLETAISLLSRWADEMLNQSVSEVIE